MAPSAPLSAPPSTTAAASDAIVALKARARTGEMAVSEAMDSSSYSVVPWEAVCDRQFAAGAGGQRESTQG